MSERLGAAIKSEHSLLNGSIQSGRPALEQGSAGRSVDLGFENAIALPMFAEFGFIFPETDAQAGEVGCAEGGGFGDFGTNHWTVEQVRLDLEEKIVHARAAIDAKFFEANA